MSRKRILSAAAGVALPLGVLAATMAPASAAGISGPAFYVHGELYRTVATPNDLSGTGAPDHSFDNIYQFANQPSVADAAPGDPGYNGGRWKVRNVTYEDYNAVLMSGDLDKDGVIDSAEELHAATGAGVATIGPVVKEFVCTVNKLPATER
jgi:hypothetical protein